jgi:rare lipoprotein A
MHMTIAKTLALLTALLYAGAIALLGPAGALADAGGASTEAAEAPASGANPAPVVASPVIVAVSTPVPALVTRVGSVTLQDRPVAMLGHNLDFAGTVPTRDINKSIAVERLDPAQGIWVMATSARVNRHGAFLAHWHTNISGRLSIRAVVLSSSSTPPPARTAQSDSSPTTQVTVYRQALSTYFGPGFYGQQTACGQIMNPLVVGVANRTLPCGTLVEVSYGRQRLTVPVIDRGPYANGADWDLTQGAAAALGIAETVHIGTLVVGAAANTPSLGLPPGAEAMAATGGALAG